MTGNTNPCPGCGARIAASRLARNLQVCPECGHHRPIGAQERIAQLADPGSFTGGDAHFGRATIRSHPVVLLAIEPGSAEETAGEAAETALAARLPLVAVCASGDGYGVPARTGKAYARLRENGVLTVCVLAEPLPAVSSTGGFAALSDLLVAESGTPATRQPRPGDLGPAESLLHHGRIDRVEPRAGLRPLLGRLLAMHHAQAAVPGPRPGAREPEPARPTALEYLTSAFDGFVELHGDRRHADDRAIVGGLARLAGQPVVVVAHLPGPAGPDGYHKAARLFAHAERFGLPVVTLTGAPGTRPEAAEAILCSIWARIPIVSVLLGDGRDAGPADLGVADAVVPQPPGGAHALRRTLACTLREVTGADRNALIAARHERFRRIGAAETPALVPAA